MLPEEGKLIDYMQLIFVPKISHAIRKVKINQIRERNKEGIGQNREKNSLFLFPCFFACA